MSEETTTFEELGITEPPYVEEYKKKFGLWPTLQLKTDKMVPIRRFDSRTRTKKFRMTRFNSGATFQVTGVEAGKLAPLNVLCTCAGQEAVLTPAAMIKIFTVLSPSLPVEEIPSRRHTEEWWDEDKEPATSEPEPSVASGAMGDILARRRREAMIDL